MTQHVGDANPFRFRFLHGKSDGRSDSLLDYAHERRRSRNSFGTIFTVRPIVFRSDSFDGTAVLVRRLKQKIVRFADKECHQIFLEPEGRHTKEVLRERPSRRGVFRAIFNVKIVHHIEGLENAEIMRYAYAIEYDFSAAGTVEKTRSK